MLGRTAMSCLLLIGDGASLSAIVSLCGWSRRRSRDRLTWRSAGCAGGGPGSVDKYRSESELTKVVAAVTAPKLTEDVW